jgi:2-methylaconitate cis-trans-isomerase PrpF
MKSLILMIVSLSISCSDLLAQSELKIELKDAKPDIYIDGKKYDYEILDLLDRTKIESVKIIKNGEAAEEFDSSNGVILITSKRDAKLNDELKEDLESTSINDANPLVLIDGEVVEKDGLKKLSPDKIESLQVIKGAEAIEKYAAPNGVIIVKTKK